jgi:UDP-galactopyranose mutase
MTYYPIPSDQSAALAASYAKLAEQERDANNVHFAGRLAQYAYINTDEAVEIALKAFERIRLAARC